MARLRRKPGSGHVDEDRPLFFRSAGEWVALGAPDFMVDDAVALSCYERWCPGEGEARLRVQYMDDFSLGMSFDPEFIAHLKIEHVRNVAAPHLLWQADALTRDEREHIERWPKWFTDHHTMRNPKAPAWLRGTPAWL